MPPETENNPTQKNLCLHLPGYWLIAFRLTDASSSDCPPDKKTIPGTAAGTVRDKAVTVASAFCCGVYFVGQDWPREKKKKKKAHEKEHHSNSMWYKYYNITTAGINQLTKLIVLRNLSKVRAKLLLCSTPILFLLALLLPHLYLSTSLPCTLLTPSIWR